MDKLTSDLMQYGREIGWWRKGTGFRYYCNRHLFAGVDLRGKHFLDIGCGNGRFSLWAACQGAASVLGLEPSAEGSRGSAVVQQFKQAVSRLSLTNVAIEETTFQELAPRPNKWDVVLIHAAINHLDEPACITLLDDPASWEKYKAIGRSLRGIMPAGGDLVIFDVARHNYWGDRGRTNPQAPTIEWHKHQQPESWAKVLGEAGFDAPRIHWMNHMILGPLGWPLRNRLFSYYESSRFRLHMRAA